MKRIMGVAPLLLLLAGALHAQPDFVYVNNGNAGPNSISAFSVTGSGALVPLPGSPFSTGGVGDVLGYYATNRITTCVVGNHLYVANDGTNNVSVFSINTSTGALALVPGSPFSTGGSGGNLSLGVTPDDRFLYATSGGSSNVSVFQIAANGALNPIAGSPFSLPGGPDGIKVTPDGNFLLATVPQSFPPAVAVMRLAANGTPTPIAGSPFPGSGATAPTGVDADCANQFAFAAEANGDRTIVDAYARQPGGALTHIPGSPFTFFSGANSNVAVLSPDDRFLFVSNQNSSTITVLNVAANGSLSLVPGSPFSDSGGFSPTLMATNRQGTLLFAANGNGTVSSFNILGNGALSPVAGSPFFTGSGQRAGVVAFPPKSCSRFCTPSNVAPVFVPPTPACGSTLLAVAGTPFSFGVSASDVDSSDVVTLGATGVPAGATLTPPVPVTGNPATTSFSWTPGVGDQGDHIIRFTASDLCGNSTSCSTTVHVTTNRNPDCSHAVASEVELWPANHKYHAISVLGVTDPDSDAVRITVTGITQDEPANGRGDGNTCPDAQIASGQASVRAERAGTPGVPGNGRVYAISFTADDGRGGQCTGTVYVCVPHDQHEACIDDGQRYNSLGPCINSRDLGLETVSLTVGAVTNKQAQLTFVLPTDAHVDVTIFDLAGRRLATIEDSQLPMGEYERSWNMDGVSNGMYFVRLRANGVVLTRTLLKLR